MTNANVLPTFFRRDAKFNWFVTYLNYYVTKKRSKHLAISKKIRIFATEKFSV